jgi:hypothetical protein
MESGIRRGQNEVVETSRDSKTPKIYYLLIRCALYRSPLIKPTPFGLAVAPGTGGRPVDSSWTTIYIALCAAGLSTEADSLFEVSAIAIPAANMATTVTIRFISRNQN